MLPPPHRFCHEQHARRAVCIAAIGKRVADHGNDGIDAGRFYIRCGICIGHGDERHLLTPAFPFRSPEAIMAILLKRAFMQIFYCPRRFIIIR